MPPLASTLYRGEKVWDDSNYHLLIGDGVEVFVEGERRLLSRLPVSQDPNHNQEGYSSPFEAAMQEIPRSEWDARIDEQIKLKARVSDYCDFPAFDQDGLPTCWAIGTAQSGSIARRMQGLPHIQLSGCSLAVPISGGHRGGYEGDSMEYAFKYGIAAAKDWPENNTNKSLNNSAAVSESRMKNKVTEFIRAKQTVQWASGCLLGFCGPFAYNWMSHVMSMCDFVRIERGSYGFRVRNSWSNNWGAKNDLGFGGFAVYREGRGTPDSGLFIRQMTQSWK